MIKEVESYSLAPIVTECIRKDYGEGYRATMHGEIFYHDKDEPYDKYVGDWQIVRSSILVIMKPK